MCNFSAGEGRWDFASSKQKGHHFKGHLAHDIFDKCFHSTPPVSVLCGAWCLSLPSFNCFLQQQPLLLTRPTSIMHFPVGPSRAELSAKPGFVLWDQFLPRMLCQLPCLLPAINCAVSPGQTNGQKSGKQLTVRAAPTQHVLSEGMVLAWSFWVAGPAWPNLWIFDHSPGSLIFHLRLLFWPPHHGSLGRCDMALWTLNSSEANKNSTERRRISLGPPQRWQCLLREKVGVVFLLAETSTASTMNCQVESVWFGLFWQFL